MATYNNPIGTANPFFTTPAIVLVVRNVRLTGLGELVAEDAQDLPRFLHRIDFNRVQPHQLVAAPPQRNIPQCGALKKAY